MPPALSPDKAATWRQEFEWAMSDLPGQVLLNEQQQKALRSELSPQEEALKALRAVRQYRNGRFEYSTYKGVPYSEAMTQTRALSVLLEWDVFWRSHQHEWTLAVDSCRAAFGLACAIGDEPDANAQLLRIVLNGRACKMVARLVGQGESPKELLAELRKDIQFESAQPHALWIVRGIQKDIESMFRERRQGTLTPDQREILADLSERSVDDSGEPGLTRPTGWLADWRRRATRDWCKLQADAVEAANRWTSLAMLPVEEQGAVRPNARANSPYLFRLLDKSIQAHLGLHAQLRATDAGLAVECYREKHGRWPERLDDLTPEFCDAVPIDIYTGKPLQYRRHKDGVVVYSVGPDEKDNGGKLRREADEPYEPYREGLDFGIMLWDVAKRRVPARPPLPLPKPQMVDGVDP
jgi:hypothetical protein